MRVCHDDMSLGCVLCEGVSQGYVVRVFELIVHEGVSM